MEAAACEALCKQLSINGPAIVTIFECLPTFMQFDSLMSDTPKFKHIHGAHVHAYSAVILQLSKQRCINCQAMSHVRHCD